MNFKSFPHDHQLDMMDCGPACLLSYSHVDFQKNLYKSGENKGVLLSLDPQADFKQRQTDEKLERKKTFQNMLTYFTPYKNMID
jgi:ATP-binding cassette subfamily B protein